MIEPQRPAGNIYDLGYRPYDGERLGRQYALVSLFSYSFRAVFGLGRSGWNKVFPFFFAGAAFVPAFIQLSIAALAPTEFTIFGSVDYFGTVWWVFPLFAATVTPELIGRDFRNRALPLYFSRALSRFDYITAKIAALFVAMLLIMITPQVLLFLGNALATEDIVNYIWNNLEEIPRIIFSSAVAGLTVGMISLALASQTNRRGLATGVVIGTITILTTVGNILQETASVGSTLYTYCILISPLDVLNGMVYWVFNAAPGAETAIGKAGLDGPLYLVAALVYTGVALTWVYRRFLRLAV